MSLINCPECNKKVSDSAKSCPHCGYELKKHANKEKIVLNFEILRIKYLLCLIIVAIGFYVAVETVFPKFVNCSDKLSAKECDCVKHVVTHKVSFFDKIKILVFGASNMEVMQYVGWGDALRCMFVDFNEIAKELYKNINVESKDAHKSIRRIDSHKAENVNPKASDDEVNDGLRREYYEDGNIYFEGNYKDGKLEGVSRVYYETGSIKSEAFYKDGKLEGTEKFYYANGQLQFEGSYKDGKKNGSCRWYNTDGDITSEVIYKDDEVVELQKH